MKSRYVNRIKTIEMDLKYEVSVRDEAFLSQSETWQQSGNGAMWDVDTQELRDLMQGVESLLLEVDCE